MACGRGSETGTATIAPAEPRPAPPATASVGGRPVVTTSGSPPPRPRPAPGSEVVTIGPGGIDVRPLLPRGHTAFHLRNATGRPHEIVVRGATGSNAASLPPNGAAVVQLPLGPGSYEIVCTTPGHAERGRFSTYAPGVPLRSP